MHACLLVAAVATVAAAAIVVIVAAVGCYAFNVAVAVALWRCRCLQFAVACCLLFAVLMLFGLI